jgi:hypothetical protein
VDPSLDFVMVVVVCDLSVRVRGRRPGHGSDILWTDSVPIGLFTAIECD